MPALSIWTPEDGLLGAVAPLALALAAGTALVVDLDHLGPRYPGPSSLADLVREGPRRSDLTPPRRGVAVLRNGGVTAEEAAEVVAALGRGWPNLVLRLPPRPDPEQALAPVVRVCALFPGALLPPARPASVYQRSGFAVQPPGPGPVLPAPRPVTVGRLLSGVAGPADRWIRSWRQVWGWPWQ